MDLNSTLYIPRYITFRRYQEIHVYDLKNDESYIIDKEAFDLLKIIDGKKTCRQVLEEFPKQQREDILEALKQFNELEIVSSSNVKPEKDVIMPNEQFTLPDKNPFDPPFLKNLMINITEKCNLNCKHCYITDKNQFDMPIEKLKQLIEEFYNAQGIRLILTGGEPLLYERLSELLEFLKSVPIQKVILSNGVLIEHSKQMLELLKENHVEIYVSLDGLEASHDDFRNADCYTNTMRGIKLLLEKRISVSINTMVHSGNLGEFDKIHEVIKGLGKIKNWSVDIPTFDESTPKAVKEKYQISFKEGGQILKDYGWGVMYESGEGAVDYACGPFLMAVDVTGKVTKCGFFSELSPGNVFELGLKKCWEKIQKTCNWNINELACKEADCEYLEECRGGCRYRACINSNDIKGIDKFKCYQFGHFKE